MTLNKRYYSYIRVSTLRQGQTGTSLAEQREAIHRYADRWNLPIVHEFEEKETAAKMGRPVFSRMIKALKRRAADGIIIHKIDRSARNLRDWSDLGELIDNGLDVHFVNESLDMNSRGGRLSADIQAVVAADYIRNLREETKKGFYGRLKQGYYPRPAPIGYLDRGKCQPKDIDPVKGPLVRRAFQLYSMGNTSLDSLVKEMHRLGLRGRHGKKVSRNGLAKMLRNPFYVGLIRIQIKDEVYAGRHRPLISQDMFDAAQATLEGKAVKKPKRHEAIFRRAMVCGECDKTLIGEYQKGIIYYRCHTPGCAQKTTREDDVEAVLLSLLMKIRFTQEEDNRMRAELKLQYKDRIAMLTERKIALSRELGQIQEKLSRYLDAYIDGLVDERTYVAKKNELTLRENTARRLLDTVDESQAEVIKRVEGFIELVNDAYSSYIRAERREKGEIIRTISSNVVVQDKKVLFEMKKPFQEVLDRLKLTDGSPSRDAGRTSELLERLMHYFHDHELPLLKPLTEDDLLSSDDRLREEDLAA